MTNFKRNNLDKANSPYLQQHKNNPIFWQEWNEKTLEYAKKDEKLIFVSVGYATCHWCHVMADESFSNIDIAEYLNTHFVSIKVDREERPDIDSYLMDYLILTQGGGGWPLNSVMTPQGRPFFAGTYFPPIPKHNLPDFLTILRQIVNWYNGNKIKIITFVPRPHESTFSTNNLNDLFNIYDKAFDKDFGGFGFDMKFPPHCTLLFLMHAYEATCNVKVEEEIKTTLDKMATCGLHDHIQGGFYRYCTDREWTIPHFEKMLYDQAMSLWIYSLAYKLFGDENYKTIVKMLIKCLEETFEDNGLYYSAHDADTDHEEGKTYLWSYSDLKNILTKDEFIKFINLYEISESGNFEGENHLIKRELKFLTEIEQKLLSLRNQRAQPFTDKKIITSWNALLGVAFLNAYRYVGIDSAKDKAIKICSQLITLHYKDSLLSHSSLNGSLQKNEFLEDYASFLLLLTYLYEEDRSYFNEIDEWLNKLNVFHRQDYWTLNPSAKDFIHIPASTKDHPIPSPASLAEMATYRANVILKNHLPNIEAPFSTPHENDYWNCLALFMRGYMHELLTPAIIKTSDLPINSIQSEGDKIEDCFKFTCREFDNIFELLTALRLSSSSRKVGSD